MKKKLLSAVLSATMVASMLAGCGSSEPAQTTTDDKAATTEVKEEVKTDAPAADTNVDTNVDTASAGKVYYLNFKPEQAQAWEALAAKYTEETGVQVSVQTAASGTYESTLKSEIAKTEAPTLFQVNGPVGLATWSDYCYDMS